MEVVEGTDGDRMVCVECMMGDKVEEDIVDWASLAVHRCADNKEGSPGY